MPPSKKICVGQIMGPHGVRGLVKLKSFTADPAAIADYEPLTDESGAKTFHISLQSVVKDQWIAAVEGITDRNQSEILRGVRLYVDRAALPPLRKGDYYHADLAGLHAKTQQGDDLGEVIAVHDFGAGPLLEIRLATSGAKEMLPFTDACVPVVKITEGFLIVNPPEGWLEKPEKDA